MILYFHVFPIVFAWILSFVPKVPRKVPTEKPPISTKQLQMADVSVSIEGLD